MARVMVDDGAVPMSCAMPIQQPPYYVISPPVSSIPPHSAAPHHVYYPNVFPGYGAPVFSAGPMQDYYHQYPVYNIVPTDARRSELTMQDSGENATRQEVQPRVPRVQSVPQQWVYPRAHMTPDGTIVVPPIQSHGLPMYRMDDALDTNRLRSLPSGIQYVNNHGVPFAPRISSHGQSPAIAMSGSQPYILPATQPGMQWKLVPVADPDYEKIPRMVPSAMPAASKAPLMLMASPGSENSTNDSVKPDSSPLKLKSEKIGDDSHSAKSGDPYNQILSLLFPKLGAKPEVKEDVEVDGVSSPKAGGMVAPEKQSEKEGAEATIPKSIRIIPVTDPIKEKSVTDLSKEKFVAIPSKENSVADPSKEKSVADPSKEKSVADPSKEKSVADPSKEKSVKDPSKEKSDSQEKRSKKTTAPVLKPIKLVPSLDFAKKKDGKHVNGSKEEKQVTSDNHDKPKSHHIPSDDGPKEKEPAKKVSVVQAHEAVPKAKVVATNAQDNPVSLQKVGSGELKDKKSEIAKPPALKKDSFNGKVTITNSDAAARVIQSVWRGHLVRRRQPLKHLRDIARVKLLLKDYQTLFAEKNEFLKKCADPMERTKISEGLMSLLLQLDCIQGVDPVVRDIRKYTSLEVLKLQSEVDAATQVVNDNVDQVPTESSISENRTDEADNFFVDQRSNSAKSPADCRDTPVSNVKEMVMSRLEETGNKICPSEPIEICEDKDALASDDRGIMINEQRGTTCETGTINPHNDTTQTDDHVGSLLRKLLNRLPKFESYQGPEVGHKGETLIDAGDLILISEVVKRLSALEEQRSNKGTETKQINAPELSAQCLAPGLLDKGEELIMSGTTSSANFSREGLHLNNSVPEDVSGESDELSNDSDKEKKLPISESLTSSSESELHNLRKDTSDESDTVIDTSDDVTDSAKSTPDEGSDGGQNVQNTNVPVLQKKSDVGNDSPSKPKNTDTNDDVTEIPHRVISEDQEDAERLQKGDIDGESSAVSNIPESGILAKEDNSNSIVRNSDTDTLEKDITIRLEFEGEDSPNQCETSIQTNTSYADEHKFNELVRHEQTGDVKTDQVSASGAPEEGYDSKVAVDGHAFGSATGLDSATLFVNEVEVCNVPEGQQIIDGVPQQLATPDGVIESLNVVTFDSPQGGRLSPNVGNDEIKKTGDDNDIENGRQPSVASCAEVEQSDTSGIATASLQDSFTEWVAMVASDPSDEVDESGICESGSQVGVAKSSDETVVPESVDVTAEMNVQTSDKCLTPENKITGTNCAISVLETESALHDEEDALTKSATSTVRNEATSKMSSTVATVGVDDSTQKKATSTEDMQPESDVSHLQCPNLEEQVTLNDQLTQLDSAISDLQNVSNTGQVYLESLNPVEEVRDARSSISSRSSTPKRVTEDIHIPSPPSLSEGALQVLTGSVSPTDASKNYCLSNNSLSSSSESSRKILTQNLVEENIILKEVLRDVLEWSQWQSSATMNLHKMIENLEHKISNNRHTSKRIVKTAKVCGLPKRQYKPL